MSERERERENRNFLGLKFWWGKSEIFLGDTLTLSLEKCNLKTQLNRNSQYVDFTTNGV